MNIIISHNQGKMDGKSSQVKEVEERYTSPYAEGLARRSMEKSLAIHAKKERKIGKYRQVAIEKASQIEETYKQLLYWDKQLEAVDYTARKNGEAHLDDAKVMTRRKREAESLEHSRQSLLHQISNYRIQLNKLLGRMDALEERATRLSAKTTAQMQRRMLAYWRGVCSTHPQAEELQTAPAPALPPLEEGEKRYLDAYTKANEHLRIIAADAAKPVREDDCNE